MLDLMLLLVFSKHLVNVLLLIKFFYDLFGFLCFAPLDHLRWRLRAKNKHQDGLNDGEETSHGENDAIEDIRDYLAEN